MKNRRVNILVFLLFLVILLLPTRVFCYDTNVAHPNIAELAARLYNQQFPNQKLSKSDIAAIAAGAKDEDMPTRWYNHFYDPVRGRGIWFNGEKKTALDWATDSYAQASYSLGDQSWQRAMNDWQKGDRELALRELGHTLHLIADMAVPAHTRDDIHPAGDSYEQFVKNNWDKISPQLKYSFQNVGSLNSTFYLLAKNTNANFYSDDTIESGYYRIIEIKKFDKFKINSIPFVLAKDASNYPVYIANGQDWNIYNKKVDYSTILTSYATRLIPQAIGYTAGVIDLFMREASQKQKFDLPFWRTNAAGLKDFVVGSAINYGEQAKDYFVQTSLGAPAEEIGEQILRQVDVDMTAKSHAARGETEPPVAKTSVIADVPPVTVASPDPVVIAPTTTITSTVPIIHYVYSGGGSSARKESSVDPIITTTTASTTVPVDTPTTTPTTTPIEIPTTTPVVVPTTSPTTTPVEIPTSTPTTTPPVDPPTTTTSTPETPTTTPTTTPPVEIPTTTPTTTPPVDPPTTTPTSTPEDPTPPGPTGLCGEQTENLRIFTAAGNPYYIDGNRCYVVPVGKKLIIEKGVDIKIKAGLCIAVYGELDVRGTDDSHVTISQLDPGQRWGQIVMRSATATFNYADISGGDKGAAFLYKKGIVFADENSYVEFNNSTITDTGENAMGGYQSVLKVNNSILGDTEKSDNCNNNVCNSGIRAAGGTVILDNTQFHDVNYGVRGGFYSLMYMPTVYSHDFSTVTRTNVDMMFIPTSIVSTSTLE